MLREFEIRRWLAAQGRASSARLIDVSVNDLEDRRVWLAPGVGFIKQFAAAATTRGTRERALLQAGIPGFSTPGVLAAEDLGVRGSLLLLEAAPGRLLDEVYEELDEAEYVELAGELGRALGALHAAPLDLVASIHPATEAWVSPLPADRIRDALDFDLYVSDLETAGQFTAADGAGLRSGRIAAGSALPANEAEWNLRVRGWIHGDVHNENVFYDRQANQVRLTFIDFEEAAVAPVVLDLVHPFLNILGEALPGRAFGDERGWEHPIFARFFSAYAETGPVPLGFADVAPLAVAWYLGIARDAFEAGMGAADFYLRTALAVAALLGWTPDRNENDAPESGAS